MERGVQVDGGVLCAFDKCMSASSVFFPFWQMGIFKKVPSIVVRFDAICGRS